MSDWDLWSGNETRMSDWDLWSGNETRMSDWDLWSGNETRMSDWDLWSGNEARVSHDHAQTSLWSLVSILTSLKMDITHHALEVGGRGGTSCYHITGHGLTPKNNPSASHFSCAL